VIDLPSLFAIDFNQHIAMDDSEKAEKNPTRLMACRVKSILIWKAGGDS
jgi:hypothetical protein